MTSPPRPAEENVKQDPPLAPWTPTSLAEMWQASFGDTARRVRTVRRVADNRYA